MDAKQQQWQGALRWGYINMHVPMESFYFHLCKHIFAAKIDALISCYMEMFFEQIEIEIFSCYTELWRALSCTSDNHEEELKFLLSNKSLDFFSYRLIITILALRLEHI